MSAACTTTTPSHYFVELQRPSDVAAVVNGGPINFEYSPAWAGSSFGVTNEKFPWWIPLTLHSQPLMSNCACYLFLVSLNEFDLRGILRLCSHRLADSASLSGNGITFITE